MSQDLNGSGELNDERRQRMEDGIRAAQALEHDRDMLKRRLDDTLQRCASLQAELGAVQVDRARLAAELEGYRRERDDAVGGHAEALAILAAAATILTQQVEKSKAVKEEGDEHRAL